MAILHVKTPNGVVTDFPLKDYLPLAGGVMDGDIVTYAHDYDAETPVDIGSTATVVRPVINTIVRGDATTLPENDVCFTYAVVGDKNIQESSDSQINRIGVYETSLYASGTVETRIMGFKLESDSVDTAWLTVGIDLDGKKYYQFDWKNIAFIDSSDTTNKSWIRFTNGTQILSQTFTSSSTANTSTTVTFNKPFAAYPYLACSINKYCLYSIGGISGTGFTLTSDTASCVFKVIAIGRWK